jgi:hypothetical protein
MRGVWGGVEETGMNLIIAWGVMVVIAGRRCSSGYNNNFVKQSVGVTQVVMTSLRQYGF